MLEDWSYYSNDESCPCEDDSSPYHKWTELDFGSCCIDVEFFCLLIADMAEEAEMRLRKEESK